MSVWPVRSIDEVCQVVNGGTPKTGESGYWDGPHFWVTPAEMGKRPSPYIDQTERTLTDAGIANSSARLLPPHSVILSSRAPIGHLVINTVPMSFNQGCKGLIPKDSLHYKYLYYFLLANVELLNSLGTGATFKELSGGKLKGVTLPVPPLTEQKRIVAILDEAFEGIAKATANAECNLASAQELLDCSIDAILRGKGKANRVRLGERHLLQIIDGDRGAHYPKKTDFAPDGHCLFLSTKNVRPDGFDFGETVFVTKEKDAALRKGKLARRDVTMTTRGTIGNIAVYDDSVPYEHIRINSGMLVFRPNEAAITSEFLFNSLRSAFFKKQVQKATSGAAQPQLPIRSLIGLEIVVPEGTAEQVQAVDKIDELERHCKRAMEIYRCKRAALTELKESLLKKAFSGKLTGKEAIAA